MGFQDVSAAADALLYGGERPTNDRVRGLLGRGSPNTIGPLLDRWWAALGPRLRQQYAKMDMPDAPEEVAVLATQFWTQALAAAQQLAEDSLTKDRAALEEARQALEITREALQADAAEALEASKGAIHAQRLAETRFLDAQRFNEQQALQLVDLAKQRDALQADAAEALEASKAAIHAQHLAETRLLDAQRLNEKQALQLVDLAKQRDVLQACCDRQEAEVIGLSERLRQQEIDATAQQASHAQHMLAIENRSNAEIDRARQETKDLRAQLTALARERAASEQLFRQQHEEAVAAAVASQRETELQRGRAEALEQQLARLGDLPAALQATLAQAQTRTKRTTKRKTKAT